MSTRAAILKLLSDGRFHSGTDLGRRLDVTRAAVHKGVKSLLAAGFEIHSVGGRGYRLESPLDPLDRDAILTDTGAERSYWHDRLIVLDEVDSTSQELLRRIAAGEPADGQACVAEAQTGGRGRRGRGWIATPYRNILLSLGWSYDAAPAFAAGLSLGAGVAVVRALHDAGVTDIALKWPNDVLYGDRKLAGLLVDVRGEAGGPCQIVLGIGLNVQVEPREATMIDQPWTDLRAIVGQPVDRNRLVARLLYRSREVLAGFGRSGLGTLREEWLRHHAHAGRRVRLTHGGQAHEGVAHDIDAQGALLLRDDRGAVRAFHSGEVSLRPIA